MTVPRAPARGRRSATTRRATRPAWKGGRSLVLARQSYLMHEGMSHPAVREKISFHLQWRAHVASYGAVDFFAGMLEEYDDDVAVILSHADDIIWENRVGMSGGVIA